MGTLTGCCVCTLVGKKFLSASHQGQEDKLRGIDDRFFVHVLRFLVIFQAEYQSMALGRCLV